MTCSSRRPVQSIFPRGRGCRRPGWSRRSPTPGRSRHWPHMSPQRTRPRTAPSRSPLRLSQSRCRRGTPCRSPPRPASSCPACRPCRTSLCRDWRRCRPLRRCRLCMPGTPPFDPQCCRCQEHRPSSSTHPAPRRSAGSRLCTGTRSAPSRCTRHRRSASASPRRTPSRVCTRSTASRQPSTCWPRSFRWLCRPSRCKRQ